MVVVTLAIFNRVSTPFEVFVVAGIIAIYIGVEGNMADLQRRDCAAIAASNSILVYIIELLKDPDVKLLKERLDEVDEGIKKDESHFVINTFSRVLTLLIVAYYVSISLL